MNFGFNFEEIQLELYALYRNQRWEVVKRPENICYRKWLFRQKDTEIGKISKKARRVYNVT